MLAMSRPDTGLRVPWPRFDARAVGRLAWVILIALIAVADVSGAADAPRWADPAKTLRVMFPIAETGFDPQATQDYYSSHVQRAIFDPLYEFSYLARPYRFVPNTAAAMPEISGSLPASDRFAGAEGPDCKIVAKRSNLTAILGKEMRSGNAVCHVVVDNDIAAVIDDAVLGRSQDHIVMNQIG